MRLERRRGGCGGGGSWYRLGDRNEVGRSWEGMGGDVS